MPVRTTTGTFRYADWKEESVSPEETLPRLSRASVVNSFSGGITAPGTACVYATTYVTAKTGGFVGLELLTGTVDGRSGSFVLEQRGHFGEDGVVHCTFEVLAGSATGDLAGLTGSGGFTAVPGEPEVPYTLAYELD
ncbi:DUF3224 domain-containing protein [Kitasatospora camelliae]|uniref:DUF3224 domain-containing protein n=1 Tax=Kitasatospora camelliae TaxID=3156397 RepID=A0AAU8JT89_9ACTN